MRLSVWPSWMQPAGDVVTVARHADATGWDGVWVADHFMGDGGSFGPEDAPTVEATAVLAALAVSTRHVRIGSLVLGATYRHPAVVANWAATVDQLSGGRLILGMGAGWQANEHHQYGIDLPAVGDRVSRFEEALQVVASLLRAERTTFEGRWFQIEEAHCEPKPVGRLPLLVGGKGDRMLAIAGRHADAWNMWALPGLYAERSIALDRAAERSGRDPGTIERSVQALVHLTDDEKEARAFVERSAPRAAFAGTPERFAELVAQWEDVGVDEVVVPLPPGVEGSIDVLDRIAQVMIPSER